MHVCMRAWREILPGSSQKVSQQAVYGWTSKEQEPDLKCDLLMERKAHHKEMLL